MSYRRLGNLLRYLPREAATVQAIMGPDVTWSDTENLLALIFDSITYGNWLYAVGAGFKNVPKRPPQPIRRPGDLVTAAGVTASRNLSERSEITAGSLTLAELDAVVARQTGAPMGVIDVEEVK